MIRALGNIRWHEFLAMLSGLPDPVKGQSNLLEMVGHGHIDIQEALVAHAGQ